MATIHLVRHAPTPETGKRLTGRLPGVGLDDTGREIAAAAAAALSEVPYAAVYTSPVLRCRETARILAAPHDLAPIPYRSLIEVDYGTWAGRTLGSLRRTRLWRELLVAPSRVRFPGGETLAEVQARAVAAAEDLAGRHRGRTIAVVSHGDVIKSVVAHYLGVPLDLFQRIAIAPASHSIVHLRDGRTPWVEAVNRLPTKAGS
jgi:probable phosphomutase (TIGR03848 family)